MAELLDVLSQDTSSYETHILPNGQCVFYSDETHTYIVDGLELPSITSLLSLVYGDTYAAVNKNILHRAAEHGTIIHSELQTVIEHRLENPDYIIDIPLHEESQQYFQLIEPIWQIKPIQTEQIVVLYGPNNRPIAAGRFDLLCTVQDELTLVDFKTTSTIHRQLVTAQLNLYRKAAIQSGYFSIDDNVKLGVIHLRKETSKYTPIAVLSDDFYLKFLI